jgi:hypothetical protein
MGKKTKDLFAAFVIGNGVLDLVAPRERYMMWVFGPQGLRKLILWLADHPTAVRLRGIVRIGIGLSLALKQYEEQKHEPVEEPGSSGHVLAADLLRYPGPPLVAEFGNAYHCEY